MNLNITIYSPVKTFRQCVTDLLWWVRRKTKWRTYTKIRDAFDKEYEPHDEEVIEPYNQSFLKEQVNVLKDTHNP